MVKKKTKKAVEVDEFLRWKKAGGGWHGKKYVGAPTGYYYTKKGRLYRIVNGKRKYV